MMKYKKGQKFKNHYGIFILLRTKSKVWEGYPFKIQFISPYRDSLDADIQYVNSNWMSFSKKLNKLEELMYEIS